ncbi:UDP-4-amino-4,6-dideoxy-N-acetyl-beta-L-altrosamine N-acetyltransferase [Desulfuromonas acetoxidans]|uniref:UDP-4-amino-4, 6-dideoxy-N-acetyl-beta-L-altrosamine N-acetyltransferase n=1 Tax=Desulfuromonas acetoxidans TaxID=891 RepID=UPI002930EA01|nr:UDP-4-amino-4,6-dideoxy-N-acetyl-beta-L-altrosamine N-acetyltransferase [Desulfuromonas acetoxidans]
MQADLRYIEEEDLELLLKWRNHPAVKRYMYSQHDISIDEHKRWFLKLGEDDSQQAFIFSINGQPEGYVNFKKIHCGPIADWGFYLNPDAPKGTGRLLGRAALDYAFYKMNLHKVCGQALGYNEKSINFHLRMGFKHEGLLRDQYFDGFRYHNVECFGLLADEWLGSK